MLEFFCVVGCVFAIIALVISATVLRHVKENYDQMVQNREYGYELYAKIWQAWLNTSRELQDQNESLLAVLYRIDDLSREHGEILRTLKAMEMEKLERETASLARKKPSKI